MAISRAGPLRTVIWFRGTHTDGDYLLLQRDFAKSNHGAFYEATAGGSALKGEDKRCCALFVNSGEMIDVQLLRYQPYLRKMGYLK